MGIRLLLKAQALFDHRQPVVVFGDKGVELDRLTKVLGGGLQVLATLAGHAAEHPGLGLAFGRFGGLLQEGEKGVLIALLQEHGEIVAPRPDIVGTALQAHLKVTRGLGGIAQRLLGACQGAKSLPVVGRGGDVASQDCDRSLGATRSSSGRIRMASKTGRSAGEA